MKMQPDLRAHEARFTMMTVDLENSAEHLLRGCEFVFVLQEPRTAQLQRGIAGIACFLHDLLGVTVVTLVAAARTGRDQFIDIAQRRIDIVRSCEARSPQLRELR